MAEQDLQAIETVRARVPFVYRFLGRNQGDHRPRHRFAIDHVGIDLPSIDRLPPAQYITHFLDEDEPTWLSWYDIGGVLLRRVVEDGIPATLGQIERATYLVMPPTSELEFFDDHPSAIFRVHKRRPHESHYRPVTDVARYVVLDSDHDRCADTTSRILEKCVEHVGTLLAPARPPTWQVRLARGYVYLEVSSSRLPPLQRQFPTFHFPIRHREQAHTFAELLVRALGGVRLEVQEVEWRFVAGENPALGGSLDTARAFAYHFCRRTMDRKFGAMSADEIEIYFVFRTLFEEFGTDQEADVALERVENMKLSGMGRTIARWQAMLKLRRGFVERPANPEPAHDPPISAEDLEALGSLKW